MGLKRLTQEPYHEHVRSLAVEAKTGYRRLSTETGWHAARMPTYTSSARAFLIAKSAPQPPLLRVRSVVRSDREVEARFQAYSADVIEAGLFAASLRDVFQDAPYQKIIGLGPQALPLLLRLVMRDRSAVWFWALAAIVGSDEARGSDSVAVAAAAWIGWGQSRGLL